MSRIPSVLVFVSVLVAPLLAAAQRPMGPALPMVVDLAKVPVGSWAKYVMTLETLPPLELTVKVALVARAAAGNTLEVTTDAGPDARVRMVIRQFTLPPTSDGNLQKVVTQVGGNDPMEMPLEGAEVRQFFKPDPKTLLLEEAVKVEFGSFKAKHYRVKTSGGDTVEFWLSESAPPLGLVKMVALQRSNPPIDFPIKLRLVAVGRDAKTEITKVPKPFDQKTLTKELTGGAVVPQPVRRSAPTSP